LKTQEIIFIFFLNKNPAPGIVTYHKILPYSGVDLNHHLNPLPRFERADQAFTTQKRFLDRDVNKLINLRYRIHKTSCFFVVSSIQKRM